MTSLHETRERIDKKLDKLEAFVLSLEGYLHETRESVVSRLEKQKQAYMDMLDKVMAQVQNSGNATQAAKEEIHTAIEHAKVQLALGRADTRDALEAQTKKIRQAVAKVEAAIDLKLDHASDELAQKMIAASDRLDAELEAAAVCLEIEKADLSETLARKKEEVSGKIEAFKNNIASKRKLTSKKWTDFEEELEDGLKKVTGAFKKVFT